MEEIVVIYSPEDEKGFSMPTVNAVLSGFAPTNRALPPRLIMAEFMFFDTSYSFILSAINPLAIAPRLIFTEGSVRVTLPASSSITIAV